LRVHYAVDVAAGFATAAVVMTLTPRINNWWYARRAMSAAAGGVRIPQQRRSDAVLANEQVFHSDDEVVA
jgi:membrane-associated phospholipid phosphatase